MLAPAAPCVYPRAMIEGRVDSTVDNGSWLSLVEAARTFGVSEKTVRRRVKAGQLHGRQVPSPRGPAWQVWVPTTVDGAGSQGRVDSRVDKPDDQAETSDMMSEVSDAGLAMLELVRLVSELQPKAEAAAMWQARAELLSERLAAAESRLLALAAPESPPDAPGSTETERTPQEPLARFSWRVDALLIAAFLLAVAGAGWLWLR